jgi:hypothetical protein
VRIQKEMLDAQDILDKWHFKMMQYRVHNTTICTLNRIKKKVIFHSEEK